MARRKFTRTRVQRRGKFVWIDAWDPPALFVTDLTGATAGIAVDDAIIVDDEDWKVVNNGANEKATLVRTVIHEVHMRFGGTEPAIQLSRVPFMFRCLYTAAAGVLSPPTSMSLADFITEADVLYSDLVTPSAVPNGTGAAASPHTTLIATDNNKVLIDSRTKRKLESDSEIRFLRYFQVGFGGTIVGSPGFNGTLLARVLLRID